MNTNEMIVALDEEISRLRQIRELLSEATQAPKRRGRPKGSGSKAVSFNPQEFAAVKRTISAEGRERIASAQRARWAKQNEPAKSRSSADAGDKSASASTAGAATRKPSTTKQAKRGRPATNKSRSAKRPVGRPPGSKNARKRGTAAGKDAPKKSGAVARGQSPVVSSGATNSVTESPAPQ